MHEKQRLEHESQMARLRKRADQQNDIVEQKARAWELKWMKTVMQQHQPPPAAKTDMDDQNDENNENNNV